MYTYMIKMINVNLVKKDNKTMQIVITLVSFIASLLAFLIISINKLYTRVTADFTIHLSYLFMLCIVQIVKCTYKFCRLLVLLKYTKKNFSGEQYFFWLQKHTSSGSGNLYLKKKKLYRLIQLEFLCCCALGIKVITVKCSYNSYH